MANGTTVHYQSSDNPISLGTGETYSINRPHTFKVLRSPGQSYRVFCGVVEDATNYLGDFTNYYYYDSWGIGYNGSERLSETGEVINASVDVFYRIDRED